MAIGTAHEYRLTSIEAKKFEEAIASARERGASDVDPRVHKATIEALESELALLREQLAEYEARKVRI